MAAPNRVKDVDGTTTRQLPDAVCRQPWKNLTQAFWIARLWTYNFRPVRPSLQSGP